MFVARVVQSTSLSVL